MHIQAVSELEPESVCWLWLWRLGLGKPALLEGDPGVGKSLVSLDLCARLSRSLPMPDGSPGPGACNSLVLAAEDGLNDTVRPRLQTLGADLNRVFVVRQAEMEDLLRLPSQVEKLDAFVAEKDIRFLVIDPVIAYFDVKVQPHNDQSVRRALMPLAQLGQRRACSVMMQRHLNKEGKNALYRGGGSIGFQAVCRSSWLLAVDPDAPEQRRVLAQVKNNLAPPQPSLVLEICQRDRVLLGLNWLGESQLTANELLGKPARPEGLPRQQAAAFLKEFLPGEPKTTRAIWDAGVRLGLSKRTMQRAREEVEAAIKQVCVDGVVRTYWLLPDQELPGADTEDPNSLERWLRPLREKYPPPSPLDESD